MATNRMKFRVVILGLLCNLSVASPAQNRQMIPDDESVRPARFDMAHETLFFGAGVLRKNSKPIHSYSIDGTPRGPDINIFNDFTNLDHAIIDGIAVGPEGKTVIAAVLNFGSHSLKHVILTYDSSDILLEVWDTEPYYHEAIATDDAGDVFALGSRLDDPKVSYPLLIEYGPSGQILRKSLSSALFKNGSQAVEQWDNTADPLIAVAGNHLLIYAPKEADFLVCSKEGAILRRWPIDPILSEISDADKATAIQIRGVVFVDDNRLVFDLTEDLGADRSSAQKTVLMDLQTGRYKVLIQTAFRTWLAVGLSSEGTLLVLSREDNEGASLKSYDLTF